MSDCNLIHCPSSILKNKVKTWYSYTASAREVTMMILIIVIKVKNVMLSCAVELSNRTDLTSYMMFYEDAWWRVTICCVHICYQNT